MKQHISVVGVLHLGLGILYVLAALIVAAILVGTGFFVMPAEDGITAFWILVAVAIGVGLLLLVLALPGILGGWGVLKYKSWARYLVLVLAVLNLPNLPVGTAVGIYTLWVLINPETERLFAGVSA